MTVREMLRRMTSAELTEWMAYYSLQNAPAVPEKQEASLKDQFTTMFAHRIEKVKK